jgi:hypothetical protein
MRQNDSWVGSLVYPENDAPDFRSAGASLRNLSGRMPAGNARPAMQDLTMLLFTAIFFALAFLYVKACQKLR